MTKLLNVQDHIDFMAQLQKEQPINMTTEAIDQSFIKEIQSSVGFMKYMMQIEHGHLRRLREYPQNETTKAFIHYCQYSIEQLTGRLAEYENFVEKNEQK